MAKLIASAGPFLGVRSSSTAPYIDYSKYLAFATNGYFRDVNGTSSWLARPGFTQPNSGSPIGGGAPIGQGMHVHVDPVSGTITRFFVVNGALYRSGATFTTFTDVTPVGITIDNGVYTRVAFASVGTSMVVSDGVNRPWVATNLTGSPITGTYIDIDGAAGAWTAYGPPTVYQDSVFWITNSVPGGSAVNARIGIVWSEPNQPSVGYTQSGYADFWNLIETGADPLYCIFGTNTGLFYWRQSSIGLLAGTPSISFSTTATRDARSTAVGSVCPWAVVQYQDNIFFLDARGRPWMMSLDGDPQPIWSQLTDFVPDATAQSLPAMSYIGIASVVPELNQVIMYVGSGDAQFPPTQTQAPVSGHVFDGLTGVYAGRWLVGSNTARINVAGVMKDSQGVDFLCLLGSLVSSATYGGGYLWNLSSATSTVWNDNNSTSFTIPNITTGPLSYSANHLLMPDQLVAIVNSNSQVTGVVGNDAVVNISPNNTGGTNQLRLVMGCSGTGARSLTVNLQRSTALTVYQWGVQRIELYGATCLAGPEDY